jgi:transposase
MPKKITIVINESEEFLQRKLSGARDKLKRDRIKTLLYIKDKKKYHFQSEIGKKLGRTEKTIRGWIKTYQVNGYSGLLAPKIGGNNTRTISDKALKLISKKIRKSHNDLEFSSFIELKILLEQELDEIIDYNALYSHLRRKHKEKFILLKKMFSDKRNKKGISPRLQKKLNKLF